MDLANEALTLISKSLELLKEFKTEYFTVIEEFNCPKAQHIVESVKLLEEAIEKLSKCST